MRANEQSDGYGIGLAVVVPKVEPSSRVRLLPLPDFLPVTIGALWPGKPNQLVEAFLTELQERAKWLTT